MNTYRKDVREEMDIQEEGKRGTGIGQQGKKMTGMRYRTKPKTRK